MKKFYKKASLLEKGNLFSVGLDGRAIKTPLGHTIALPSKALAEKLVEEWDSQKEDILPQSMPLTQIVTTHLDKTVGQRESVYQTIFPYVHGDTILYFNGDEEDLFVEQEEKWLPFIRRFEKEFGVSYTVQKDIIAQDQAELTFKKWIELIECLRDEELTFFQIGISLTASPLLTWYFMKNEISIDDVVNTTLLEEIFQSRRWGRDVEGERKENELRKELSALREYLSLVRE